MKNGSWRHKDNGGGLQKTSLTEEVNSTLHSRGEDGDTQTPVDGHLRKWFPQGI